jgi:hypothetical protein
MPMPGEIVTGMLYLGGYRNGLLVWTQPGGIGTPVFPQYPQEFPWFGGQNDAEAGIYEWPVVIPSQYIFGCLHKNNCPEVYQFADIYNDNAPMVAVVCPQCSYIQQILTLEAYQNNQITPLIIA